MGKKRVGLALSDELSITAQPLETVSVKGSKPIDRIEEIVSEYGVEAVVVGHPLKLDGTESTSTRYVDTFVERLKGVLPPEVKIILWDERLSTVAVTRVLLDGDVRRDKRRGVVDKLAAAYILQGYLDNLSAGREG